MSLGEATCGIARPEVQATRMCNWTVSTTDSYAEPGEAGSQTAANPYDRVLLTPDHPGKYPTARRPPGTDGLAAPSLLSPLWPLHDGANRLSRCFALMKDGIHLFGNG
jgi:hypothetical protein